MLQLKEEGARLHGGGGADDDADLDDAFADFVQSWAIVEAMVHQMGTVARIARGFRPQSHIIDTCLFQHSTNFIDCTVGVGE